MRILCILFASLALAQTPPAAVPPPTPAPPAAAPTAAELMRAAVEKQRASVIAQQDAVRKQAQSAGATLIPWSPPTVQGGGPAPICDPIAAEVVTPLIDSAAKTNEMDGKLVRAVIEQESGFRPCAVSPKGAQGLMQLMPETAAELSVKDAFDPKENIAAGVKYLKQLLDKYKGDTKLALAAYNAGPSAVDAIKDVPDIPETRDYVDAIMKKIK
jgi:soluble lytic murein transglycosylase-like protein